LTTLKDTLSWSAIKRFDIKRFDIKRFDIKRYFSKFQKISCDQDGHAKAIDKFKNYREQTGSL
jgi:hypothetical protein